ncbi:hypothetical protein PMZ80_006521 [Knufia obscura]|uniref:Aminoglycoside phosphotransferase domain-containing protein n=1 Tax=Knufia obscura TaxID=1635080 RepID=A0ABR0RMB8_9EURO|nr:hypothetical protein PMZ80_006521 [Knufia obscura]
MAAPEEAVPIFLDKHVNFPNGRIYELLQPLTNYRSCHDGTPQEARIVFLCKETEPQPLQDDFVMKIKVQLPWEGQTPQEGPSTTTAAEIKALEAFRDAKAVFAPQLVAFHQTVQDNRGPLPGGFLTFTVMTKMPGQSLFGKYWNMTQQEQDDIKSRATEALRSIYALGIEPVDRGLRNVIWHSETKQCSIIDFELWNPINGTFADEKNELQRWGLLRTPVAKDHWTAWNQMHR